MRALALLVLVAACEREWVREYEGSVPGTWEELTSILLVRDAFTGRPIAGATVRQYAENELGRDGRWAPLLAEGRTDEFGLVTFRHAEMPPIAHWTVHADGYAPTEEYGQVVVAVVELRPGRPYQGRLLSTDGSPLAGAVVEWKVGCAHAPALASATCDEAGLYRFECIDSGGDFVVEDPRGAAEYIGGPRGPGFGIPVEQVLPGRTIRGRVVARDGTPPPWAVVAAGARAPRATTDPQGRFVLQGFEGGALEVWRDGPWTQYGEDFAPGLEARLLVGSAPVQPRNIEVPVRVRDKNGAPPPVALFVHFDSLADGSRLSFEWSPWSDDLVAAVRQGTYRVSAGDPCSAYVSEPKTVRAVAGRAVELVVRPQPTLAADLAVLEDSLPPTVRIVLEELAYEVLDGDPVHLPAVARALLRVDLAGTPYTFPIGPEQGGVRRADVRLPGRKDIRIPGLEHGLEAALYGEDASIVGDEETEGISAGSAGLATRSVGERWLMLAHREKGWAVVRLDLPFEAATIEPDCMLTPWPDPVELRVVRDDGAPVPGACVNLLDEAEPRGCLLADDGPSETDERGVLRRRWLRDGLHVRIDTDEGSSWARLRGPPPYEVRLGTAAVELDLAGLDSAAGVLDGAVWKATDDALLLGGLSAGAHTLIVGAEGRRPVAYGLILRAGERRRITPDLPARE